jgi:hypothetical protein
MIAIVNSIDRENILLDPDWVILEYDTHNIENSGLAALYYTSVQPNFAVHLFNTTAEFDTFKTSSIWGD